jgi:hypothetical protein
MGSLASTIAYQAEISVHNPNRIVRQTANVKGIDQGTTIAYRNITKDVTARCDGFQ